MVKTRKVGFEKLPARYRRIHNSLTTPGNNRSKTDTSTTKKATTKKAVKLNANYLSRFTTKGKKGIGLVGASRWFASHKKQAWAWHWKIRFANMLCKSIRQVINAQFPGFRTPVIV